MHRDTEHFRDLSSPRETLGALPALQPGWTQHLAWKTSACALGTGCTRLFFFWSREQQAKKATGTEPGVAACTKAGPEPSKSTFREQSWGREVSGLPGESGLCSISERYTQSNAAFPDCRQNCLQSGRSTEYNACDPVL